MGVNTEDFYLPQNRPRVYIVGVHTKKAKMKVPFDEWEDMLDSLRCHAPTKIHDYLLEDDEAEIEDEVARLEERTPGQNGSHKASTYEAATSEDNRYGIKWVRNHIRYRKGLGMGNERPLSAKKGGWAKFLSLRSRDVLDMTAARVSRT